MSETSSNLEKQCTKCGATKAATEFRTRKGARDGLTPWCRSCLNEASASCMRARLKDPAARERAREKDRARYQRLKDDPAFRERERVRSQEYCARQEVKARAKARSRAWATANHERMNERAKKWRQDNPERVREIAAACIARNPQRHADNHVNAQHVRRWRMYNQGAGRVTALQARLCRAFWGECCAYCGNALLPAKPGRSIDHVAPLSGGGGHGPENIVACCKPCNDRKGSRHLSQGLLLLLAPQLDAFVEALPQASYYAGKGHPLEIMRACFEAEQRLRDRGVPVGTEWVRPPPA